MRFLLVAMPYMSYMIKGSSGIQGKSTCDGFICSVVNSLRQGNIYKSCSAYCAYSLSSGRTYSQSKMKLSK